MGNVPATADKDRPMASEDLVRAWFENWEDGDFRAIPVTDDFEHISPFGTISGRQEYLDVVEANQDQFLGFRFDIHDEIYDDGKACVRYTARKGEFSLDASEWFFGDKTGIQRIISYYNVGGDVSYQDFED